MNFMTNLMTNSYRVFAKSEHVKFECECELLQKESSFFPSGRMLMICDKHYANFARYTSFKTSGGVVPIPDNFHLVATVGYDGWSIHVASYVSRIRPITPACTCSPILPWDSSFCPRHG